jgi:hypothetical protein
MSGQNEQKEKKEKNTYSQTSRLENPEELQLTIIYLFFLTSS